MIIYGSRSKLLARELVTDKCPNCASQNSTEVHLYQRWAHVFWIPFVPIGKTIASQCGHCKQVLKEKEMPSPMQSIARDIKSRSKTPIWTFTGLALLAVLIVIAVIDDKKNDEKIVQLILAPKAGDVLEMKTAASQYTLYKVAAIEGDTVLIRQNNMETNKLTGLWKLKEQGDNGYSEDVYAVPKSELKAWFDKGEIMDVERK